MTAATDRLNLVVRSRAEGFRWDVTDTVGRTIGTLHPELAPSMSNDTSSGIMRKVTGIRLTPDETADLNPLTDRIKPYHVLDTGDEHPLGVFLCADTQTSVYSYGDRLAGSLVDQGLVLAQEISESIGFDAGTSATSAITSVLERAGFYDVSVSVSTFELGAPLAWPAGSSGTTYASILADLCGKAGAYPCYFDNNGTATVRPIEVVDDITATLDYTDSYSRTTAGSIVESNDLLLAPNRFLAIDTSATDASIFAVYDIPDSAPHSYVNRGFHLTKVVEAPGVGGVAQALAAAQAAYTGAPQAFATATWSSPPDPRHDTFDIVRFRGSNWLETAWSLECKAGGVMSHKAQRVYL